MKLATDLQLLLRSRMCELKNLEIKINKNKIFGLKFLIFTFYFVLAWNLISHPMRRREIEDVWKQGAEENI
jgi:hypothetical protein